MSPGDSGATPSRRRLIAALGSGGALGLAGCSGPASVAESTPTAGTATPRTWRDGGPPERSNWTVTFQDDFAAGVLDRETWSIGAWAEGLCAGGTVDVCFADDHVTVDSDAERLVLEASTETPTAPTDARPPERDNDYTAGAVTTKESFAQEFGYFEVKARIPDQPGTLPACWLFCDPFEHDWREIELFEKPGASPASTVKMGTWFEADPDGPDAEGELTDNEDRRYVGATTENGTVDVSPPPAEAFLVYALEWGPESLTWYVDGDRVGSVDHPDVAEHLPGQPLFWILNHNVYEPAPWVGDPADATFPNAVEFDWVRAWQHEDWY